MHGCAFLPLTTGTLARLCAESDGTVPEEVRTVRARADEVEAAAVRSWTVLLAGCRTTDPPELVGRLRGLSEATACYVGKRWWFGAGSAHRHRVAGAQTRLESALAESDGGEFARAFVTYDHAMAGAVVCARGPVPTGGRAAPVAGRAPAGTAPSGTDETDT
ncbi:hypothetical protein [Saccharomonospora iraqiensis]|uniref:hypothetical protein n=1 Tax=Saccharomonospora iraqiensis TaxID=52698 RepID=UPI00040330EB|nr:hypothetical protein [Saccharomonospora iraqiensis]